MDRDYFARRATEEIQLSISTPEPARTTHRLMVDAYQRRVEGFDIQEGEPTSPVMIPVPAVELVELVLKAS